MRKKEEKRLEWRGIEGADGRAAVLSVAAYAELQQSANEQQKGLFDETGQILSTSSSSDTGSGGEPASDEDKVS